MIKKKIGKNHVEKYAKVVSKQNMQAHYEKPLSCKTVMHAESVSPSCKKSVHQQEAGL